VLIPFQTIGSGQFGIPSFRTWRPTVAAEPPRQACPHLLPTAIGSPDDDEGQDDEGGIVLPAAAEPTTPTITTGPVPSAFRAAGIVLPLGVPTRCHVQTFDGDTVVESVRPTAFGPSGRVPLSIDHAIGQEATGELMCEWRETQGCIGFLSDQLPDSDLGRAVLAAFLGGRIRGVSATVAVRPHQRRGSWSGGIRYSEVLAGSLLAVSLCTTDVSYPQTWAQLVPA
jgi:hypothetical protein